MWKIRKQQLRWAYFYRRCLKWVIDGGGGWLWYMWIAILLEGVQYNFSATWCCPMLCLSQNLNFVIFNVSHLFPDISPHQYKHDAARMTNKTPCRKKIRQGTHRTWHRNVPHMGPHIKKVPFALVMMRGAGTWNICCSLWRWEWISSWSFALLKIRVSRNISWRDWCER